VEQVFKGCDAIVAASGTVTLQAAIHGTPMVIMYKVSPVSFWLGKALVRVPNIGLVNLVAGEQIVPELVQHEASAENIASAVENLLADEDTLNHLKQKLFALRNVLGGDGASERVADLALGMLDI
jgi:lipid-A-disaccharide synthase